MKYAHIDKNNILLGWYADDVHDVIPTPNIQVTEENWQYAIDNNHNKVNADGTTEKVDTRTQKEIDEWNATEYQRNRKFAYKSVEEQMDMLYWDKVNGTNLWEEHIFAIKNKYPKA